MVNFWKIVNNVIAKSDVILEVIDARLPQESRNIEIENKIKNAGKELIIVINKCDLVEKDFMEKTKKEIKNSVFVSSIEMLGTTILKKKILETGRKDKIVVGILGYPNTGKSSVINALSGKSKAKTSSVSGQTRGIQYINAGPRMKLIDTPGVVPFMESDDFKHVFIGTLDSNKVDDPEGFVMEFMGKYPGVIETYYDVDIDEDWETSLENIALKGGKLIKGGFPDTLTMAKMIINDWQKGKININ